MKPHALILSTDSAVAEAIFKSLSDKGVVGHIVKNKSDKESICHEYRYVFVYLDKANVKIGKEILTDIVTKRPRVLIVAKGDLVEAANNLLPLLSKKIFITDIITLKPQDTP